jgi:hypothetical protein
MIHLKFKVNFHNQSSSQLNLISSKTCFEIILVDDSHREYSSHEHL